jgi:hypothetical protein
MSIDVLQIKHDIRQWALTASGRIVTWGKFDGVQPGEPFVSLNVERIPSPHEDAVGNYVDENDEITIMQHREIVLNVLVLGSSDDQTISPQQIAQNMISSLAKPSVQFGLMQLGISIKDKTDPIDVSALYDGTSWEKRSSFDVTFGVGGSDKDNVGYFDTVEITGEAKNENNETVDNIDITVP